MELETLLEQMPAFKQITEKLVARRQLITGVAGSARTLLVSALYQQQQHAQIVITDNNYHMEQLAEDLMNRLPAESVYQFPAEEMLAEVVFLL